MEVDNPVLNSAVAALHSGNQPHFVAFVDKVVSFCKEHENGKVLENWGEESLRQLVAYHQAKGTLIVLCDDEANVQAVGMWYNCDEHDDWSMIQNWSADKKDGNAVFMAFLYATSTAAFKRIILQFIEREPDILWKKLIGVRQRNGVPTRTEYTAKLFSKILKAKD